MRERGPTQDTRSTATTRVTKLHTGHIKRLVYENITVLFLTD